MSGGGDFNNFINNAPKSLEWHDPEIHGPRDKPEFRAVESEVGEVRYTNDATLLHQEDVCAFCRMQGGPELILRRCNRCWAVHYCSSQCQEMAYERHKGPCKERASAIWHVNVSRLPIVITHEADTMSFHQPWGVAVMSRKSGEWGLVHAKYWPTHRPPTSEQVLAEVRAACAKEGKLSDPVISPDSTPKITVTDAFEVVDMEEMRDFMRRAFELGDMHILCCELVEQPADFETSVTVGPRGLVAKTAGDEESLRLAFQRRVLGKGSQQDAPKWRDVHQMVPCPTKLDINRALAQVAMRVLEDVQVLERWPEGVGRAGDFLRASDAKLSIKDLHSADPFSLFQQGVKPPLVEASGITEATLREFYFASHNFAKMGMWGRVAPEHVFEFRSTATAESIARANTAQVKDFMFPGDSFHLSISGQQGHHYGFRLAQEKEDLAKPGDVEQWLRFVDARGVDFGMLHAVQTMRLHVHDELGLTYPVPVIERAEYGHVQGFHTRIGTHKATPPLPAVLHMTLAMQALPMFFEEVGWPGAETGSKGHDLLADQRQRLICVEMPHGSQEVMVTFQGLLRPFEDREFVWTQPTAHDEHYHWQRVNLHLLDPARRMVLRQIHLKSRPEEVLHAAALALDEDPLCAEAALLRADMATDVAGAALEDFQAAREMLYTLIRRDPASKNAFDQEVRKRGDDGGRMWHAEPLPLLKLYLMASHGVMHALAACGRMEDALVEGREILLLNKDDDQEVRAALLRLYLIAGEHEKCEEVIKGIEEHKPTAPDSFVHAAATMRGAHLRRIASNNITVLYTRALLAFIKDGDTWDASEALHAALVANKEVGHFIARRKLVPETIVGRGRVAQPHVEYARNFSRFWWSTPGAESWLLHYMCLRGLAAI
mmetsp:Transcript_31254/g.99680  ORF Transcript_31254/g.99680 Transcript_31254/m.99680 type:complete len:887 (-) Transcript_31254:80-2740(-)